MDMVLSIPSFQDHIHKHQLGLCDLNLLSEWGLVTVVNKNLVSLKSPMSSIRVIPYNEKNNFVLQAKYQIGNRK